MAVPTSASPQAVSTGTPGGAGLILIDGLAAATIAMGGFQVARALDPFALAQWPKRALIALPFALLATLGVGIERGRTERPGLLPSIVAGVGAASGGVAALLQTELRFGSWSSVLAEHAVSLLILGLAPLLIGPFLTRLGARFARPDEPWREAAREGPPAATPPLALRIARLHVPAVLRVLAWPLALVGLPFAAAGMILIRCYQLTLSRLMPPQCRFEPSCSRYGFQAFWRHGVVKGAALTAYRVGRCQPFCQGGHDPVPGDAG